jgi:hypothetical protein
MVDGVTSLDGADEQRVDDPVDIVVSLLAADVAVAGARP